MNGADTIDSAATVPPEDLARANLYRTIARLFYAPPDEQLLGHLLAGGESSGETDDGGGALDDAWREVLQACRGTYPVMLEKEHTTLFVGIGKCEITPYLSHYTMLHESDAPLAELRETLLRLGIARREGVPEYEDHVAGLLEIMAYMIAVQQIPLDEQKRFYERYVYEGAVAFCAAVTDSKTAVFYKHVARFARIVLDIEHTAFEMVQES